MDARVLVLYYSQTGQLKDIADNFTLPLKQSGCVLEVKKIPVKEEFTFPWTGKTFFNAMPESVLGVPSELYDIKFEHTSYDLIILAYQPWFLSPSIPATSLLHNPDFLKIAKGANVLTLIGCRNMWIMAQEDVKALLKKAGANLVGNVVLRDRHSNLLSAVSILHWMLNGKKTKLFGIFPKPGVSEQDIKNSGIFGKIVAEQIRQKNVTDLQQQLVKAGAVEIDADIMFVESRAKMLFNVWANIIIKKQNRTLWLKIFKYYLVFALFIVSPIVLAFYQVFKLFLFTKISRDKKYYSGVI